MATDPANSAPPPNEPPTRSAWPRRGVFWTIYLALAGGAVALVLGALSGIRNGSAPAQLEREIAAAQARGEPVWFSDLRPAATDPTGIASAKLLAAKKQLVVADMEFWDAMGRVPGEMRKGDAAWKDDLPMVRKIRR